MRFAPMDSQTCSRPRMSREGWRARWFRMLLLASAALLLCMVTRAEGPVLMSFDVNRGDEGVLLSYAINIELPRGADEALSKAVPLFFVAEAEVFRDRWYWRDKRVAEASRVWRIVFQPLTSNYRVTFGGLSQTYPSRAEALAAISRNSDWRIAEPGQIEDGRRHYVEFNFRLDTTLLPRPMQIGISGQPDWTLQIVRAQRFN